MVYDITNKKSFDDLKEYWHDAVLEQTSKDIIFHVVGNKIDLFEREVVNKFDVEDYCKTIDAEVSYISAKEETNSYVDALFNKLGEKFINSDLFKSKEYKQNANRKDRVKLDDESEIDVKPKEKNKCC